MRDSKSQNGFQHEYELGKKLGEGCHSSVYKCVCKKENKLYAVKILK
jgi:serine/threonine protein kinase